MPNTEVAIRTYTVCFFAPSADGRGDPTSARGVQPKDLRIVSNSKGGKGWEAPPDLHKARSSPPSSSSSSSSFLVVVVVLVVVVLVLVLVLVLAVVLLVPLVPLVPLVLLVLLVIVVFVS